MKNLSMIFGAKVQISKLDYALNFFKKMRLIHERLRQRLEFLKRGNEHIEQQSKAQIFDKRDQELTEENEVVCIMGLYLNLVSVMIKADPCDNGTGVQESASWVL